MILARPEMREFLGGRPTVVYPEPWMDRVETMRTLQGWGDASILHYRDLARFGERLLLSIRLDLWTDTADPERAASWARFWREEVQGYIHAYRAVRGFDLSVENVVIDRVEVRSSLQARKVAAGLRRP